ncbi:ATP-binding protein [Streptomyces pacificus]|uniref:ATP-binding protein n=1 Tax=Streptomyces pacificus TaxID=2705029 RepID=UPI0035309AB0
MTLAATPNAVAWARRHTVDILQRWRFPDEGIEVARLIVSELATNAIRHAHPTKTSEAAADSAGIGTIVLMLWPSDGGIHRHGRSLASPCRPCGAEGARAVLSSWVRMTGRIRKPEREREREREREDQHG